MRAWLVVAVCACGSKQSEPKPVIENKPVAQPIRATCSDVGVILRGRVDMDVNDEEAGRAKEAAIRKSCSQDKWPQTVIDCIASTPQPDDCLAKLDEKQHASYDERLAAWAEQHTGYGGDPAAEIGPPPMCDSIIGDVATYEPPLGENAPERDWVIELRRAFLYEECDHAWSEEIKDCLRSAGSDNGRATCLGSLDEHEQEEMTKKLESFDRLATKVAAAKQKPESITCKKVVATHYGNAAWKKKLDGFKAAERKKMIDASRALMQKACDDKPWDERLRACVVAGGGETCFETYSMRLSWGYPAAGAVTTVGIQECDDYGAAIQQLAACSKIPQTSRESLKRSFDQTQAQVAGAPAKDRARMAPTCKAGLDAIANVAASVGC